MNYWRSNWWVLCSCCMLCGLSFGWAQNNDGLIEKVIAKVNDNAVFQSEVIERYFAQKEQGGGSRCDILEVLLQERVLSSYAELDSLPLEDAELDNILTQRIAYVVAQVGSEAQVRALYGKTVKQLTQELRIPLRRQLLAQKMQEKVTEKVSLRPEEVRVFFEGLPLTDRPYYSMEVRLGQIVRKPTYGRLMKERAYNEALGLREQLLAGDSFERLARSYSMDPSVAQNGGVLGFFKLGELDPQYEAAALRLDSGTYSMPVLSAFGYHIIELLELRGTTYNSRHILIRPRVSTADVLREEIFLDSLRKEIDKGEVAFEAVAKEHSKDRFTGYNGGFFIAHDNSPYVPVEQLDPVLFFALDSMKLGTLSGVLPFNDEKGEKSLRIIYYKDRILPHAASFEQDFNKLKQSALLQKKADRLAGWFENAYKDMYIWIDNSYQHCAIYATLQQ